MKRLALFAALGLLSACGDSNGPGASWAGTWQIQFTTVAGYHVNPAQISLTLRDSAGKVVTSTPSVVVTDTAGIGDISWSSQALVMSSATAHDSIRLVISGGTDQIIDYHWLVDVRGTLAGTSASGSVLLGAVEDFPSQTNIGTWTATKQ